MSAAPTLGDVLSGILNTVVNILLSVVNVIAQNAGIIATLLVIGGLVFLTVRYGRRIFAGITELLRGLF